MKTVVIGAGIGGLAFANAMQRRGHAVTVYERAPELAEVGAGIWIPPNAMAVLERLGLDRVALERSFPLQRIVLCNAAGQDLSVLDLVPVRERFGFTTQSIHRATLQGLLADAFEGELHFGKACESVDTKPAGALVRFADGEEVEADVVIGADGIHSAVRRSLFGELQLRDTGQTCFRGIGELTLQGDAADECREVWGGRCRFGYSPIAADRVYWFAPISKPFHTGDDPKGALVRAYADFPGVVREVIEATPSSVIIETELYDYPPQPRWWAGRVALLGDAIHATTPNMGQGAAQAMESAYSLARMLDTHETPEQAFAHYQQARHAKASMVNKRSFRIGEVAHWQSGWVRGLRDLAMGAVPSSMMEGSIAELYSVD
jgi:2-polyprenyl-6-methoxyphenol hydroxylase-like FAD-dependent oxidoreductase